MYGEHLLSLPFGLFAQYLKVYIYARGPAYGLFLGMWVVPYGTAQLRHRQPKKMVIPAPGQLPRLFLKVASSAFLFYLLHLLDFLLFSGNYARRFLFTLTKSNWSS